jgi:hypothetical protein
MTRNELQTLKEYAKELGLYVNDKSWSLDEMFSIKFSREQTWGSLLDATYSDLHIIGMPKHFTYRYYTQTGESYEKKLYDIREISLEFVKKKLQWYSTAPKRYNSHLKQKELQKDFE